MDKLRWLWSGIVSAYKFPQRLFRNFDKLRVDQRRNAIWVIAIAYLPLCGFPIQSFGIPEVNALLGAVWMMGHIPLLATGDSWRVWEGSSPFENDLGESAGATVAFSIILGYVLLLFDPNQVFIVMTDEVPESSYLLASYPEVFLSALSLAPLLALTCLLIYRHLVLQRQSEDDLSG